VIRESVSHYFGKPAMEGIDPDHVVSLGASLQASRLLSEGAGSFLLDVTPLALRIGTVGGFTETVLERNTPVPTERSKVFTTSRDNQEKVKIRVLQGESPRADECESLGEFEFSGFRKAGRGEVQIQVTFEVDTNGIVNVSAMDLETGQRAETTISLSSGLSEAEIATSMAANESVRLARGG